jgi:predicted  nucleic acid-binding Zn-ribbon protein
MTMPDKSKQMAELATEAQSLKERLNQLEDQLRSADAAADGEEAMRGATTSLRLLPA